MVLLARYRSFNINFKGLTKTYSIKLLDLNLSLAFIVKSLFLTFFKFDVYLFEFKVYLFVYLLKVSYNRIFLLLFYGSGGGCLSTYSYVFN